MNWAHLHLLSNHIPVIGTLFGLGLFGWGLWRRNATIERVALGTFALLALVTVPVYFTGEPAEGVVEHSAGVSESVIATHEGSALVALVAVVLLGVVAVTALYLARGGRTLPTATRWATLLCAIVTAGLMARTANLGGQIRHPELRAGAQVETVESDEGDRD